MKKIKDIIDYIMVFLMILLSIKKGGFYKSDTILFNLSINIIAVIIVICRKIKKENIINIKSDIGIMLLFFSFSYILPILFNNYSSLNDSVFEMIRYYNIYLIYVIVSNSKNKKIYINGIIIMGVILCILGFDQLGSGYFNTVLDKLNTGYLVSNNISRMSSTIQYANVFALICLISSIFLLEKYNNENTKIKKIIYNVLFMVLLLGIILSQSRLVISFTVMYLVYYIIKNKERRIEIITNIIYSLISSFVIINNINSFGKYLYLVLVIIVILNVVISIVGDKLNLKKIGKLSKKQMIIGVVGTIVVIVICSIHKNTVIYSNSKEPYITRNMYNIKEVNTVNIQIKEMVEDTRYEIEIFKVNKNNEHILVDKMYYYSTTTGIFEKEILKDNDLEYINVNINCTKGKLKILCLNVNGKEYTNYLLLPSELIYRFHDTIYNKHSISYRIEYIKDAIKIWKSSIKNIVFGTGGEGFRNGYRYFKTADYSSTEVHNIYIQILVESGIIGFVIVILLVYIITKKYEFSNIKIACYLILIHGMFDLDFSYMIMLSLFSVILALLKNKNEAKKCNKYFSIITTTCVHVYLVAMHTFVSLLLIKAVSANYFANRCISKNDNILDRIKIYEKIVNIDSLDYSYRFRLNEMYDNFLKSSNDEENINKGNVISNMEKNLDYLQKNEVTKPSYLVEITNGYLYNLNNFAILNKKEDDYERYLNNIYSNLLKMYNCQNKELRKHAVNLSKEYINELNMITFSNSSINEIVKKYKLLLENIV